jgi:hypothetical protein
MRVEGATLRQIAEVADLTAAGVVRVQHRVTPYKRRISNVGQ